MGSMWSALVPGRLDLGYFVVHIWASIEPNGLNRNGKLG